MNKYQVILSNNDVLMVKADGVDRDGTYLWFYEFTRDDAGNPKPSSVGEGFECTKVAEFASWNGWNYAGVYHDAETPAKQEAKAVPSGDLTGADIAQQLQDAIKRQAASAREPKVTYDPSASPPGYNPYMGDN